MLLSSIFSLIASHITLSNIHISTTNKTYPSSNSGIPQLKTILSGFVIRGYLGLKTFFTKTIALVFAVSSGLIIGKQGPLIHISTCIGNILSRFFVKYSNNEGKRREILSAASAAGVAVAFAAPIGGVLFSLEQISYYFPQKVMLRSFFCALISVVVIKFINPLGTGKLVIFQVSYDQDWKFFELIPFLFLGILGGLLGSLFIKISTITTSYQSKLLESRPRLKVVLITIATCILSFTSSLSLLNTSDLLAELFTECNQDSKNMICTTSTTDLVSTLFIKIIFTLLIQDLKIPSGIFIPLMSIGAILGRLTGLLVNEIASKYPLVFPECTSSQCVIPGVYAMVGASSLLTGSTRITISLAVIMFDLLI